MVDPVLASRARRGLPWFCGQGWHKWAVLTSTNIQIGTEKWRSRTEKCRRCGTTRRLEYPA